MKKLYFSLVALLFCLASFAQIENPVKWSYSSKKLKDGKYEVHLTAAIAPGWHLYAQDAGEGPVPTAINFDKNPLLKTDGEISETGKLQKQYDPNFQSNLRFYSNKVDFVQVVKLKAAVSTMAKGTITYMVCNDKKCLPPKDVAFSIKIDPKA